MPVFRRGSKLDKNSSLGEEPIPDLTHEAEVVEAGVREDPEILHLGEDIDRGIEEDFRGLLEPPSMKFLRAHEKSLRTFLQGAFFAGIFLSPALLARELPELAREHAKKLIALMEQKVGGETALRNALKALYDELGDEFYSGIAQTDVRVSELLGKENRYEPPPEPPPEPIISGFEAVGISKDQIGKILTKSMPKEWIRGNVGEIRYVTQALAPLPHYGEVATALIATCEDEGLNPGIITFGPEGAKIDRGELLNDFLVHEVAHTVDPLSNNNLSLEERVHFMSRLVGRIKSPNRFQSSYVENITNEDPKKQLLYRATEYWAVIFALYFSNPEYATAHLSGNDLDLIQDYLRLTAPTFNPDSAAQERQAIIAFTLDRKISDVVDALMLVIPKDQWGEMAEFIRSSPRAMKVSTTDEGQRKEHGKLITEVGEHIHGLHRDWQDAYRLWIEYWLTVEALREKIFDIDNPTIFNEELQVSVLKIDRARLDLENALERLADKNKAAAYFKDMDEVVLRHSTVSASGFFISLSLKFTL